MKTAKKVVEVELVCDYCGRKSDNEDGWISFQEIQDNCLRVFQRVENGTTRHLRMGLRYLDFCSQDCACAYSKESIELFIKEVSLYKEEKPMVKLA